LTDSSSIAGHKASSLYLDYARSARPLPRGFTGHVAHPIRSIPVFLSTLRHAAFRNSPLQKLQQTILKLVRCPRSLAPALVTLPSMSLIPFAPFGDVMANEHTSVTRIADREELPLLVDSLTLQAAPMNWWTLALPSVMRLVQAIGTSAPQPFGLL
jgi:hypothetical protein